MNFTMVNNLIDSSRFSILHSLRTGNIILDTVVSLFIAYLFNIICNFNFNFKTLSYYLSFRTENTLSFQCTQGYSYGGRTELDSSETFKALLFYIKSNVKDNNTKKLYSLTEYYTTGGRYDDDDLDSDDSETSLKETIYFINQYRYFNIDNELTKNIDFYMFKTKTERNGDQKKTESSPDFIYTLKLKSKTVSLKRMQTLVETIHKQYKDFIDAKYNDILHIFMYMGTDKGNNLKFKSYPFKTTCNLDKLYFDDKKKIMNQINFFEENKEWYVNKGKPYTLGICSHGKPGCGKTSFEKALAKKLKRHIIIVDLSKIKTQNEADDLFFSDTINGKNIPYDKRMYIFPDIDRMSDIINKQENEKKTESPTIAENPEKTKDNEILGAILKEVTTNSDNDYLIKPQKSSDIDAPLNLSKLLNILDGIPERTGQIVMMSTNHPEKLDDALLRPGRIDCMIEFKKASYKSAVLLIENFFEKKLTKTEKDKLQKIDRMFSPAELFKLCSENKTIDKVIRIVDNIKCNQ